LHHEKVNSINFFKLQNQTKFYGERKLVQRKLAEISKAEMISFEYNQRNTALQK